MRYKIGFEFPFLDQKNLQQSHSHFAFAGWVTHTIMVLMIVVLSCKIDRSKMHFLKKYDLVLGANLACSYGMLISFIIQGYGMISILFSTLSIFIGFVFAYLYFRDLKLLPKDDLSKNWFKAGLFFNVISSVGSFYLAYIMLTKHILQNEYLASVYYYLHFQYNGWFFFACMGLLVTLLNVKVAENSYYSRFFYLLFFTCIPAYFLSTLWLDLPFWVYVLTVVAALIQVYAWAKFLIIIVKARNGFLNQYPLFLKYIFLFAGFALSLKFVLQLASTIPVLSQLTFGFRPIVIAYLHLILLAVISLFLLFYIFATGVIQIGKYVKFGLITFTVGVLLNEAILAVQGIASFSYTAIPFINEMLFGAAIILVLGIGITFIFALKCSSVTKIEDSTR
ncbi:hypothetical protein [Flavobacterium antarcticum]|uniref:hypothetical protein n=2 Tax=Flavobacterium antarcticum TaxID=271155 RepID=UPI0003B778EF